jgi:hypothetical protein
LCVAFERSKRLFKIRFALAKRSLPLVVSRALALNRLLLLSKSLDQRLALSDRELGSIGASKEFNAVCLERCASRLHRATLFGSSCDTR